MFTTLNTVTIPLDAAVAWYSGTKIKGTVQGAGAVTIAGTGITLKYFYICQRRKLYFDEYRLRPLDCRGTQRR
jgi:hypothetical protein